MRKRGRGHLIDLERGGLAGPPSQLNSLLLSWRRNGVRQVRGWRGRLTTWDPLRILSAPLLRAKNVPTPDGTSRDRKGGHPCLPVDTTTGVRGELGSLPSGRDAHHQMLPWSLIVRRRAPTLSH
jgi:hypothetical protein